MCFCYRLVSVTNKLCFIHPFLQTTDVCVALTGFALRSSADLSISGTCFIMKMYKHLKNFKILRIVIIISFEK